MLIGEYNHTIDHKKRVAIPSKFRKTLGKGAIITRGLDNCVAVYPLDVWNKKVSKLGNLAGGQANARGYVRIFLSGANDVEFDKLGRILVADHLRDYAFLKKNVTIIGLSDRIEIWDEIRWKEYKEKMEKTAGGMDQQLEI